MRSNFDELPDFIRQSAQLGADGVYVKRMHFWNMAMKEAEDIYRHYSRSEIANQLSAARAIARSCRLKFRLDGFDYQGFQLVPVVGPEPLPLNRRVAGPICPMFAQSIFIQSDGGITPCCVPNDFNLGSSVDQSFAETWNSPGYQQLRSEFFAGQYHSCCRSCKFIGLDREITTDYFGRQG